MQRFPEPHRTGAQPLVSPAEMVRSGLCIGCGSCAAARDSATMRWDDHGFLKPAGDEEWLEAPSDYVTRHCPFSPAAANEDDIASERFSTAPASDTSLGRFEAAYVGHVSDGDFRTSGSSGGLTSWVAAELLATGAVDAVAHVGASDPGETGRFFEYRLSRTADELSSGAKSRYYPADLSQVLRQVREEPGRYAVVGVPCFIKAIHLLRRSDPVIRERITHTLGLFCGHMKSAAMVESFAWQLQTELEQVQAVDYRRKDERRPANWYRAQLRLTDGKVVEKDWWDLADGDWGAGFFQNPACNWCDDVVAETADIAFGDAWVEPYSSDGRGTNVVIVRSKALKRMIEDARSDGRLQLKPVGPEFVIETQAAGLRHRREGLAYRLTWRGRRRIVPNKRVRPSARLPLRRKVIYRLRYSIARWSSLIFPVARRLRAPALYLMWARAALHVYQAFAWSNGRLGKVLDRLLPSRRV